MPRPISSGTLLYRGVQVLIVHPSGNYNRHAPWSIPKGLPDEGESLEDAARRETLEETGVAAGLLFPLGAIDYSKSRKTVHCFAGELPDDVQWRCASWEVDKVELVDAATASELLHPDQRPFIDRLLEQLANNTGGIRDAE